MSEIYEFGGPERVSFGTIGPQGQRVFYLQAREGQRLFTVKLEKQQVAALALHLGEILQDLVRPGHLPDEESRGLETFDDPKFVVGAIGVAYDAAADRLLLVVQERVAEDEEGDEARVMITREQAGALAILGTELVESGRPPCPLCGFPLDPRGHACPWTNGHHAPLT